MGSAGGVVTQPALGRAADVYGYAVTYIMTSGISIIALVFILLARSENIPEDRIEDKKN